MDKTDRLRDYGLAFLLYEQGLGICGYGLIRELFIFIKLILNSYLNNNEYWGIAFDDTDITEEDKCRFYAALSVDNDKIVKTPVTEEIKSMNLPYGKYAVFTHKGDYNKLDKFYDSILCSIDFELGNTPILEKYLNSPKNTSKKDLITEIWLPLLHAHIP